MGELVHNGETIKDTNITDLFHEVLRARKLGREPKGWDIFSKALKETNVPTDLIGNRTRWDSPDNPVTFQSESASSPGFITPVRDRLRKKRKLAKSSISKGLNWSAY